MWTAAPGFGEAISLPHDNYTVKLLSTDTSGAQHTELDDYGLLDYQPTPDFPVVTFSPTTIGYGNETVTASGRITAYEPESGDTGSAWTDPLKLTLSLGPSTPARGPLRRRGRVARASGSAGGGGAGGRGAQGGSDAGGAAGGGGFAAADGDGAGAQARAGAADAGLAHRVGPLGALVPVRDGWGGPRGRWFGPRREFAGQAVAEQRGCGVDAGGQAGQQCPGEVLLDLAVQQRFAWFGWTRLVRRCFRSGRPCPVGQEAHGIGELRTGVLIALSAGSTLAPYRAARRRPSSEAAIVAAAIGRYANPACSASSSRPDCSSRAITSIRLPKESMTTTLISRPTGKDRVRDSLPSDRCDVASAQ